MQVLFGPPSELLLEGFFEHFARNGQLVPKPIQNCPNQNFTPFGWQS